MSDNNGPELNIWQFLTFSSLLIAIFGQYLKENSRHWLFIIFFCTVIAYVCYTIYIKYKKPIDNIIKKKEGLSNQESYFVIPFIIEFLFILKSGFIAYFICSLILFDFSEKSFLIAFGLVTIDVLFRTKNKEFTRTNHYDYRYDFLLAIIVVSGLLMLFSLFQHSGFIVLKALSYMSLFVILYLFFIGIHFFSIIFKMMYNKKRYNKINILKYGKFSWKHFTGTIIMSFMIMITIWFLLISPTVDRPESISTNGCIQEKIYDFDGGSIFGTYRRLISTQEDMEIEYIFKGILEKDGEYIELDLLNQSMPKSHIQYFKYYLLNTELNSMIFVFIDKNVYLMDDIFIRTKERIC